jgi:hypothetical protein
MGVKRTRWEKGIELTPDNVQGVGGEELTREGELATDSSDNRLKVRVESSTRTVVTENQTQTLTNKTLNGANISSPTKLEFKKDTLSNLVTYALTASEGELVYATDTKEHYTVQSTRLVPITSTLFEYYETGEAISVRDNLYINSTDGKVYKLDVRDSEKARFAGIALQTGILGATIRVAHVGLVKGYTGLTTGDSVYASVDVPGSFQLTKPGINGTVIGTAISATSVYVNASLTAKTGEGAFTPTFIPDDQTFVVPEDTQVFFYDPIILGDGATLQVDGKLIDINQDTIRNQADQTDVDLQTLNDEFDAFVVETNADFAALPEVPVVLQVLGEVELPILTEVDYHNVAKDRTYTSAKVFCQNATAATYQIKVTSVNNAAEVVTHIDQEVELSSKQQIALTLTQASIVANRVLILEVRALSLTNVAENITITLY